VGRQRVLDEPAVPRPGPARVHTATWPHRGTVPRVIAQPAIEAVDGFTLDGSGPSPVAQAIVSGMAPAN
jgi:hypothetical protein